MIETLCSTCTPNKNDVIGYLCGYIVGFDYEIFELYLWSQLSRIGVDDQQK